MADSGLPQADSADLPLPRADRRAAFRSESTPDLGVRYWVALSVASVAGCNLGDFLSLYLHWGHWAGLPPLAIAFAAILLGERCGRAGEGWYWAAILVVRTAATNLADLATHTFHIAYPWVIAGLEGLQALLILRVAPRRASGSSLYGRPLADGWYWASMATAGTLGTAIGDCTAETFGLGTGLGTLALGLIYAVLLVLGFRSKWSTRASYWLAVIGARSAGTTLGDWIAFPDGGGAGLGLLASTGLTCAVFAAILVLWRPAASAPRR